MALLFDPAATPPAVPETIRPRRRALLVLGMHRSGTSLLAHILHVLGAAMPRDVIGPGHGNPDGHWEPRALVAINDEVLNIFGRSWDDPRPIDPAWFASPEAARIAGKISAMIEDEYGDAALLLIKDPRICRLAPLYLQALAALDIAPHAVLALRPHADVADSLQNRNGFNPEFSEYLWMRSIIEAERATRSCSRSWVFYNQLLDDWRAVGCCILKDAGCGEVEIGDEIAARIGHFIKSPGRRAAAAPGEPHWLAQRVWRAAAQASAGNAAAAVKNFDAIAIALQDFDRLHEGLQARATALYEIRLEAMVRSTSWRITRPLRALKRRKIRKHFFF